MSSWQPLCDFFFLTEYICFHQNASCFRDTSHTVLVDQPTISVSMAHQHRTPLTDFGKYVYVIFVYINPLSHTWLGNGIIYGFMTWSFCWWQGTLFYFISFFPCVCDHVPKCSFVRCPLHCTFWISPVFICVLLVIKLETVRAAPHSGDMDKCQKALDKIVELSNLLDHEAGILLTTYVSNKMQLSWFGEYLCLKLDPMPGL